MYHGVYIFPQESVSPSVTVIHIGDEINLPTVLQDRSAKKASSTTTTTIVHHNSGAAVGPAEARARSSALSGTRPDVVDVVSSPCTPTPTPTGEKDIFNFE